MKRHRGRLIAVAAAAVPVLALTACAGSTPPASTQKPVNKVFTYDTTAPVMVDGWDPATEYSDGIIAMSEMYETLTRYNSATNTVGPLLATSWTSADGAGGQGRDPAHDQAERRRLLYLGRGQDDRHARPVHAGLPPELRVPAGPAGLG